MKKYLVGILFIVASLGIFGFGAYLGITQVSKNYEKITGVISKINEGYYDEYDENGRTEVYYIDFYVTYTYNGKEYNDIKLDYSDSFKREGDKIDFYVNVDNPSDITINPGMGMIICIILGAVFMVVGVSSIIIIKKRESAF